MKRGTNSPLLRIYQKNATLWKTCVYLFILAVPLIYNVKQMKYSKSLLFVVALSFLFTSCFFKRGGLPTSRDPGTVSTTTGLKYTREKDDGSNLFVTEPYHNQPDLSPQMVFIEGGRTVLGSFEEDIMATRDNVERTVSVASFYMDITEVANIHWLEYLYYLKLDSGEVEKDPQKAPFGRPYREALPDTNVWKSKLAFNDPYVDYYLRYPGFRFFPVVGVDWNQANNYAVWRTDKVNARLAEEAGQTPTAPGAKLGRVPIESGYAVPAFRLPTEAEWEYAAQAMIGTQWLEEMQTHQRVYPWDGHAVRNPYGKAMGTFLANFKRGRGDYAGIAGRLNDGALITSHVFDYVPNDFGLYNMAGNVSEWVMDVYRPLSHQDFDDLNPIRRDDFLDDVKDTKPQYVRKDSVATGANGATGKNTYYEKQHPLNSFVSLVSDKARVYKGGSWKDVAYWMSPGTRRFLDQDSATATIGFRCAMINAGSNY